MGQERVTNKIYLHNWKERLTNESGVMKLNRKSLSLEKSSSVVFRRKSTVILLLVKKISVHSSLLASEALNISLSAFNSLKNVPEMHFSGLSFPRNVD